MSSILALLVFLAALSVLFYFALRQPTKTEIPPRLDVEDLEVTILRGQETMLDEVTPVSRDHFIRVLSEFGPGPTKTTYSVIPCPLNKEDDWKTTVARMHGLGTYRVQLIAVGPPRLTVGSVTMKITEKR